MDPLSVRRRIDELIRSHPSEDYASVARKLGRNPAYIHQFIRRGVPRRLSEDDRRKLAALFGVSERSLGGPDASIGRAVVGTTSSPLPDDLVQLPYYDVGASAGPGAQVEDARAQPTLAFHERFVRELASGDIARLSVIRVEGDSMFPTLSDGDEIVVDSADGPERLRDGIYVLRRDDALLVKRLSPHPAGRRLSVRSDNQAYPSFECEPDSVSIIGRVVWVGRRLS